MKFNCLLFILALSSSPLWAKSGGEVGNGGDILICSGGGQTATHSFDAYVARQWESQETRIVSSASGRERLLEIARRLVSLDQALAKDLSEFADDLFRGPDYSRRHVWLASALPLTPIEDENSEVVVEPTCRLAGSTKPNLYQAVIRHPHPQMTTYFYNETAFQALKDKPTDLAFLLLHEWLWGYTQDVIALRQLNFLLNSTWLERVSAPEFSKSWRGLTGGREPLPTPKPEPWACTVHRIDDSRESTQTARSWSECLDFFEDVKDRGPAAKSLYYGANQMLGRVSYGTYICRVELRGGSAMSPYVGTRGECEAFLKNQIEIQPAGAQPVRAYFNMEKIYSFSIQRTSSTIASVSWRQ